MHVHVNAYIILEYKAELCFCENNAGIKTHFMHVTTSEPHFIICMLSFFKFLCREALLYHILFQFHNDPSLLEINEVEKSKFLVHESFKQCTGTAQINQRNLDVCRC